ncbi:MAG: DUF4954 family protein [Sphaerochaeta sp.]|jgi:hypothetical protein|uniref:DUF4954 family protein n=1 Tax=Sphaerochaeta sp. TaxID=1972642 RepID=UPI002FC5D055
MSETVTMLDRSRFGYDFITAPFLSEGQDEYYLRNQQLQRPLSSYRHLRADEVAALEENLNSSTCWEDVLVTDPFDPSLIRNSEFYGLIRLGRMEKRIISFHDFGIPVGISNSRLVSCDIGDGCAILDCAYLSHYIISNTVILYRIGEMQTTNHAKFGSGILKEGESEEVRITMDIMNEAGGRTVRPFNGMLPSDAFLWGTYRDDQDLMRRFEQLTEQTVDPKRGYYGFVGEQSVIKSCDTIKDVWIGPGSYIKGANKLKNLMLRSTLAEPVQIGEGVELVNGIIGSGSRIFYGCKAIRFIMGDNCNLKYGARLIHSFLGDNSTVSCCELLSNLIFGGHEQHHNNSFLIASLIKGQSNMAAGANIGSNHNSRGNDGEMVAGRGFWPALSSTLKYDCKFASYVLITKGNYPNELNIPLPFSLLSSDAKEGRRVLMPAYWWMYNLYALERNSYKYRKRDKRKAIRQHIETDYLAPDTVNEIFDGCDLLCRWVAENYTRAHASSLGETDLIAQGRRLLVSKPHEVLSLHVFAWGLENSNEPVEILKPVEAYQAYQEMLRYYAVKTISAYCHDHQISISAFQEAHSCSLQPWLNVGGQLVPESRVEQLKQDLKRRVIDSWDEVHEYYEQWFSSYELDKARHAMATLHKVLGCDTLNEGQWQKAVEEVSTIRITIESQVFKTKEKDFNNRFRESTYRNLAERDAVLGCLDDNPFIQESRQITEQVLAQIRSVLFV